MVLIVLGVVGLVGGGLLLWGRSSALSKVQQLKTATYRTAGELQEMSKEIAGEIGPGSYSEFVEIRGTIECAEPLVSELSETECVYYKMSVDRKYEEEYEEYDEHEGRSVIRRRTGTDNVASNQRTVPFIVRDETGSVEVLADGAEVDSEKVLAQFNPEDAMMQDGMHIGFGRFSLQMGGGFMGGGRRTLGYELEEWALPVGRKVYALGEVSDSEGRLAMHKPTNKKLKQKFIITTKSKAALVQGIEKKALFFMIGAIVSFVAGVGMVIGGIVAGL